MLPMVSSDATFMEEGGAVHAAMGGRRCSRPSAVMLPAMLPQRPLQKRLIKAERREGGHGRFCCDE